VVDMQYQDQCNVEGANDCYAHGVAECERANGKVSGEKVEIRAQACLPEPVVDVFWMLGCHRRVSGGFRRLADPQQRYAFNRRLENGGRFCHLSQQESITRSGGVKAAGEIVRKPVHLAPLRTGVRDG
jgi:hypothetical protein